MFKHRIYQHKAQIVTSKKNTLQTLNIFVYIQYSVLQFMGGM